MAGKKSWVEKRNEAKGLPKVVKLKDNARQHWHGERMAIPAPIEVDALMRKVPKGKLTTIAAIREAVAKKHGADIGCPLTCGIFAWVAANAAEEERDQGKKRITPWWRTLKTGGFLNEKYPHAIELQKVLLEEEGQTIIKRGKKFQVENYENRLTKL